MPPKSKPKKNPRNAHRGTKLSSFRFSETTLAEADLVASHLSRPDGLPRSRADAIRVALAKFAAEICTAEKP